MAVDRLQTAVALLPQLEGARARGTTETQAFLDAGGVIRDIGPAAGYRARHLGFAATGTGAPGIAVANWIAQIKRKAGE